MGFGVMALENGVARVYRQSDTKCHEYRNRGKCGNLFGTELLHG